MLKKVATLAIFFIAILSMPSTYAMGVGNGGNHGGGGGGGGSGGGKGRTKIDFMLKIGDFSSSRFFAKIDVSGAVTSNGTSFFAIPGNTMHGKSRNFELAGYDVTLSIGSASFTGTADSKGKVSTPFSAKLTANGNIAMIKATGLNLEQLLPVTSTDGTHQVTVEIKLTASKTTTDTSGVAITTFVTLSDQNVTFTYTVKNGQAKGKNF